MDEISLSAYKKSKENTSQIAQITNEWQDWTPTLTWSTATPESVTAISKYKIIGSTLFFNMRILFTNGLGATGVNVSLPIIPATRNILPFCNNYGGPNNSFATRYAVLRDNGVDNDIRVDYTTFTSGQAGTMRISGFYEIN